MSDYFASSVAHVYTFDVHTNEFTRELMRLPGSSNPSTPTGLEDLPTLGKDTEGVVDEIVVSRGQVVYFVVRSTSNQQNTFDEATERAINAAKREIRRTELEARELEAALLEDGSIDASEDSDSDSSSDSDISSLFEDQDLEDDSSDMEDVPITGSALASFDSSSSLSSYKSSSSELSSAASFESLFSSASAQSLVSFDPPPAEDSEDSSPEHLQSTSILERAQSVERILTAARAMAEEEQTRVNIPQPDIEETKTTALPTAAAPASPTVAVVSPSTISARRRSSLASKAGIKNEGRGQKRKADHENMQETLQPLASIPAVSHPTSSVGHVFKKFRGISPPKAAVVFPPPTTASAASASAGLLAMLSSVANQPKVLVSPVVPAPRRPQPASESVGRSELAEAKMQDATVPALRRPVPMPPKSSTPVMAKAQNSTTQKRKRETMKDEGELPETMQPTRPTKRARALAPPAYNVPLQQTLHPGFASVYTAPTNAAYVHSASIPAPVYGAHPAQVMQHAPPPFVAYRAPPAHYMQPAPMYVPIFTGAPTQAMHPAPFPVAGLQNAADLAHQRWAERMQQMQGARMRIVPTDMLAMRAQVRRPRPAHAGR